VDRHDKTLRAIFADPVLANIKWADIESMLRHLGADITEGSGSRVRIALRGIRAVFHRPHPRKETDRGAVRSMRRFLVEAGVSP
jgi:hypothetical protein